MNEVFNYISGHLIKISKRLIIRSDYSGYKLSAVIFYKRKILAKGYNTEKSNPKQYRYNEFREFDPKKNRHSTHAEMSAILHLLRSYKNSDLDFSKLSIFIYREDRSGNMTLAKPCKACEKALRDLGIVDIYYTNRHSIVNERYL